MDTALLLLEMFSGTVCMETVNNVLEIARRGSRKDGQLYPSLETILQNALQVDSEVHASYGFERSQQPFTEQDLASLKRGPEIR